MNEWITTNKAALTEKTERVERKRAECGKPVLFSICDGISPMKWQHGDPGVSIGFQALVLNPVFSFAAAVPC